MTVIEANFACFCFTNIAYFRAFTTCDAFLPASKCCSCHCMSSFGMRFCPCLTFSIAIARMRKFKFFASIFVCFRIIKLPSCIACLTFVLVSCRPLGISLCIFSLPSFATNIVIHAPLFIRKLRLSFYRQTLPRFSFWPACSTPRPIRCRRTGDPCSRRRRRRCRSPSSGPAPGRPTWCTS